MQAPYHGEKVAGKDKATCIRYLAKHSFRAPEEQPGRSRQDGGRALDSNPPKAMIKILVAIRTLKRMVLNAQDVAGIVLRIW
jgi:hypothetical protein